MAEMTDEEVEELIDRAAEKAAEKAAGRAVEKALQTMYVEIGKNVLQKAVAVIGIALVALAIWASNHFK